MEEAEAGKAESKKRRGPTDGVKAILRARPGIIQAIIKQAREGSYQHAKFLFEYAGIANAETPAAEAEPQQSLAALLLEKLQIETEEQAAERRAREDATPSVL